MTDANTLEAARQKLNGFEPKVTRYGANAEAWYFDDSHCVRFVDGFVRISTSARATSEGSKFQPSQPRVLCAPSQLEE